MGIYANDKDYCYFFGTSPFYPFYNTCNTSCKPNIHKMRLKRLSKTFAKTPAELKISHWKEDKGHKKIIPNLKFDIKDQNSSKS